MVLINFETFNLQAFEITETLKSYSKALGAKVINIKIRWKGKGVNEVGYDQKTKKTIIKIDPGYFRPTEIDELRGDSRKARRELGWKPKMSFKNLSAFSSATIDIHADFTA